MKRLFSILLLLICTLSLSACGREPYTKTAVVMDTVVELQADDGEQEQAVEEGIAYLKKLDALASQKDGSDLTALRLAAGMVGKDKRRVRHHDGAAHQALGHRHRE